MENIKNLTEDFNEIFNSVQLSSGSHKKASLKLSEHFNLVDFNIFFQQFLRCTNPFLFIDTKIKNPYVDRVMEFIGIFCYTLKKDFDAQEDRADAKKAIEHPFLEHFFSYILKIQNVVTFTVRVRSCQMINRILSSLVDTSLSTEFCDKIEEAMLERLNDTKLEVRLEAILAIHRFQEKQNPLDKIIDQLKIIMEHDRFAKVRRLCVEKIALRSDVIPILLLKIRDVDIGVRLAAFTRLSKLAGSLTIEQRRLIIKCASLDSSDKIKNYIESSLLPFWLECFKSNILCFMKAVRFDASEIDVKETNELCEFIVKTFIKSKPLDNLIEVLNFMDSAKLVPYEELNWETSNYWRIIVQYIHDNDRLSEELDNVLPELVHFCNYIRCFCEDLPEMSSTTDFLENQFILKQLFTITKIYDVSDPISRSSLNQVVRDTLRNVALTLDTVEVIVSNLETMIVDVEKRARYINELISEISSPENIDEEIKIQSKFTEKIRALKEEVSDTSKRQERAINEKNYMLADSLEHELKQLANSIIEIENERYKHSRSPKKKKEDIATNIKNLDIAAGFLLSPNIRRMTSSLETLKTETIYDLMTAENPIIQSKALHCYGLFCLIDKKAASDGIHIFSAPIAAYQGGQECDIQILNVCIGSIVDLLRIYGTQLIAAPEENTDLSESQREEHQRHFYGGTSLTKIIQGLVDLMDDEQIQVQETAGRGLCSLILSNTIQSSSLLSRMVLKWCNPYEGSQKLKQMIGVTLQKMPYSIGFHMQWENAILITLKTIVYAPDNSPYLDVSIDDIAKFMVALYHVNLTENERVSNFAMNICLEILKKPKAKPVLVLSKLLNTLNLSDDENMDDLFSICEEIRDKVNNRMIINNIIKFVGKLNVTSKADPQPIQVEDDDPDESDDDTENNEQI
ncbi:hypothetical protein WA026_015050 [Henosepilachna vigintioctopunctata]|uniref:Nuclear condensin complex subunit 3 C-terminal domain-containing protein n=1 Tax=Henosepilachna vigintioctopunctata TaxID=420089 RepID=A0AAW1U992_9CUCU